MQFILVDCVSVRNHDLITGDLLFMLLHASYGNDFVFCLLNNELHNN